MKQTSFKLFVVLLLSSACSLFFQSCEEETPNFSITASANDIVVGQSISFSENSTIGTVEWTFEGANTPSSNSKSVTIGYFKAGVFTVTAVVTNKGKSVTQRALIVVHPASWRFTFPGSGVRNNNQTIGDFCCTGETYTVINQSNKPLGYAYFFGSDGPAIVLTGGAIVPNFDISISGTADLSGTALRSKSRIFFSRYDCVINKSKTVRVGNLEYTAKILAIRYPSGTQWVDTHFFMNSLQVELTARWVV